MKKKSYVNKRIKKSYTTVKLQKYLKNQVKRKVPKEKIEEIKDLIKQNEIEINKFVDGLMKSPLVILAIKQLMRNQQISVKQLNRFKVGYIVTKQEGALLLYTMIQILELAEKKKKFDSLQDYVSQKEVLYTYSELKELDNEE